MKIKRKLQPGEYTCKCSAYKFPHRMFGGKCSGSHIVSEWWQESYGHGECSGCSNITCEDGYHCEVDDGAEFPILCPRLQEFVLDNGIKIPEKLKQYL